MKLKDVLDNYYFHTGKTSELVRQLGLAGIAVIWLFKKDVAGVPKIPGELLLPLLLIVLGLAVDLLHYISAAVIWGIFHRWKEKQVGSEDEFDAPRQLNWPAIVFFALKGPAIIAAYVLLLSFLARTVLP
jgi:hypothetical protein